MTGADPSSADPGPHAGPRSLLRTLRILETIAARPETTTLAHLSQELQTPKSSLLGLLRALTQHGYLKHENARYALGPAAHRLAIAIVPAFPFSQIARPVMRDLVEETGETVLLAVLDPDMQRVVYVDKMESSSAIRYTVPVGTSRPLHSSAAGRLLLAYAQDLRPGAAAGAARRGRSKPASGLATDLQALLKDIRREGRSVTLGVFSPEVAGFSAPVFDRDGRLVTALTIGAPIERGRRNAAALTEAAVRAAAQISADLGFVPARPDGPADPPKAAMRRNRAVGAIGKRKAS